VVAQLRKYREASADSADGVVFHSLEEENHPVCAGFGRCAAFS